MPRPYPIRRAVLRLVLAMLLAVPFAVPAHAIIGGRPADDSLKSEVVMITSTRGAFCSGVVLAPRVLLTAAHCVAPASDYAALVFEDSTPKLIPVAQIAIHPSFDPHSFETRRPTPDLAVVRLAEPLPLDFSPATLSSQMALPARRTSFLLAGFGVTKDGDGASGGKLRMVQLPSIGITGGIMVRLSDGPAKGGCTGDSGGPVYLDGLVAGIIGWSTAAGGQRGCGGVTGATLVGPQFPWIDATARHMQR
ncbi:S1 family peptidase [Ancylobacter mangrovi]|uniref:S1 family peptidase n=1 Tax=Ancylobacter mangrovi TaxID=2972472 RepID=UPI002163FD09|nr:trypsin-like serine protease [Ancylobacter mangrovi]MCS0501086.1 trypsin-like serine protease [Ancylobacter mangrovi]